MPWTRLPSLLVTLVVSLTLTAGVAVADDGVVVSQGSDSGLLVTVNTEAANVHFEYDPVACGSHVPCFIVTAGTGMVGTPVSAGGNCKATQADGSPSAIECPAAGVSGVTFVFMNGGGWAAYAGEAASTQANPVRLRRSRSRPGLEA